MAEPIDLRSDAVTQPTEAMWTAMTTKPLGWSKRIDSSVQRLEQLGSEVVGKEAALFVPSGTMANTLAMLYWTRPADQFIVDRHAHVVTSEDQAFSRFANTYPLRLVTRKGNPSPGQLAEALQATYPLGHVPRTSLVWLENTHNAAGGAVISSESIAELTILSHQNDARVHLDGARVFNACAALETQPAEFGAVVDSITVNLNKGLSAPGGALLCSSAAMVSHCRRRMVGLGGAISQLGMLAAAGDVALRTMTHQPAQDNRIATDLARELATLDGLHLLNAVETNILLVSPPATVTVEVLLDHLAARNVLALYHDSNSIRLAIHRHIQREHVRSIFEAFKAALTHHNSGASL